MAEPWRPLLEAPPGQHHAASQCLQGAAPPPYSNPTERGQLQHFPFVPSQRTRHRGTRDGGTSDEGTGSDEACGTSDKDEAEAGAGRTVLLSRRRRKSSVTGKTSVAVPEGDAATGGASKAWTRHFSFHGAPRRPGTPRTRVHTAVAAPWPNRPRGRVPKARNTSPPPLELAELVARARAAADAPAELASFPAACTEAGETLPPCPVDACGLEPCTTSSSGDAAAPPSVCCSTSLLRHLAVEETCPVGVPAGTIAAKSPTALAHGHVGVDVGAHGSRSGSFGAERAAVLSGGSCASDAIAERRQPMEAFQAGSPVKARHDLFAQGKEEPPQRNQPNALAPPTRSLVSFLPLLDDKIHCRIRGSRARRHTSEPVACASAVDDHPAVAACWPRSSTPSPATNRASRMHPSLNGRAASVAL